MRRRRAVVTASTLLLGALFGACGGKESLSDRAGADLMAGVARVRAAAGAGDRTRASTELAAVRTAVDRYRGQGEISSERAADVLAAAGEVEARLSLLSPPPTPAPATTTTTTTITTTTTRAGPPPSDPGGGKDDQEGGDKKGSGKKKGDD